MFKSSPATDPLIASQLIYAEIALLGLGLTFLIMGLYNSFRVVSYYSDIAEPERSILWISGLPFILFNCFVMLVQLLTVGGSIIKLHRLSWVGGAYFASVVVAFVGTFLAIRWRPHLAQLGRGLNLKGLIALFLLVLPYIVLTAWYFANQLGVPLP